MSKTYHTLILWSSWWTWRCYYQMSLFWHCVKSELGNLHHIMNQLPSND
jgi:hypothetical protein